MSGNNSSSSSKGNAPVASNPMDQYLCALPPATSGAAASSVRAIIHQALTNPKVLAGFSELRSHPSVVAAFGGDDPALRTLDLLAKGTYGAYSKAAPGTYLTLTDGQTAKLRQLTVVTVAQNVAAEVAASGGATKSKSKKKGGAKKKKGGAGSSAAAAAARGATSVSYDILRAELGLTTSSSADEGGSVRDLEDILISCLYSGLISGRLDQRSMSLWLEPSADHPGQPPVAARDVHLSDVPRMIADLERFQKRSLNVLAALEGAANAAREGREADAKFVQSNEAGAREVRKRVENQYGGGLGMGGFGGGGDGWAMAAAAAAVGGGPAAMDLSLEGGPSASGSVARRQTKRSRAGHGGPEGFGAGRF